MFSLSDKFITINNIVKNMVKNTVKKNVNKKEDKSNECTMPECNQVDYNKIEYTKDKYSKTKNKDLKCLESESSDIRYIGHDKLKPEELTFKRIGCKKMEYASSDLIADTRVRHAFRGLRYYSLMIVPHHSGKVRTLRISSLYLKLATVMLIISLASLFAYNFIRSLQAENTALRADLESLYSFNEMQQEMLAERTDEIKEMVSSRNNVDAQIGEFAREFTMMADTYINNSISGEMASRSGTRESTFTKDINELRSILSTLNEANNSEIAKMVNLTETEMKLENYLDSIPTLWPASGELSSKFGYRRDPFTRRKTMHEGIDISGIYGAIVRAAGNGRVIFSGIKSGYGRLVIVDHGHGIVTYYGHMSKLLVKDGQTVIKGDLIGKIGNSGRSTGPHLHFEVRKSDEPIDPLKFLD